MFVARCVSPCGFDSTRSKHSDSRRPFVALVFVARCGFASTRSKHSDSLRPFHRLVSHQYSYFESAVGVMYGKFARCAWSRPFGSCARSTSRIYRVSLTPPAASAGRDSIDAFGLGGAGGAIVIGTYRKSSGFKINAYPTDANLSSYAFNFSSRASS